MIGEFLHLMVDPAHWLFELASGAIVGLFLSPLGRWAWRRALARHDAEAHPESWSPGKPCRSGMEHDGPCGRLSWTDDECACGCASDDSWCLAEPVYTPRERDMRPCAEGGEMHTTSNGRCVGCGSLLASTSTAPFVSHTIQGRRADLLVVDDPTPACGDCKVTGDGLGCRPVQP